MNRLLIRLYPRSWRDRYGEEFEDLLEQEGLRPGVVLNVVLHALTARLDVRRYGVRAVLGATMLVVSEWCVYAAGYPNILWLPRSASSAALLAVVVGELAATLEATTRLIIGRVGTRRVAA